MAATTTNEAVYEDTSSLPSGFRVLAEFPDVLMIPDLIFGGLVWILVASSKVPLPILQGWVMFVSVSLFIFSFLFMMLYCAHAHGGKSSWTTIDASYHCIAAFFYLSASVLESYSTIALNDLPFYQLYQENIAAVVFAYLATLSYTVHAMFSLIRWKGSS
ncbi:myelin and lymphocyte protein [Xenopus laevis]|uniref:Myelin and lymphocyte protein n=1 Tax=Xenopus laevis TaxID=8355 RepID=A0A8J0VBW7_XENLA|nr:myelin and lymphocyte protein [Xenopus laevis]